MSEHFSSEQVNSVITANRTIVTSRKESFGCDKERLENVFEAVNSITKSNYPDKRDRIVAKASQLLGGITFNQPFNNGNKTTATTVTIEFLRRNGFDLPITTEQEEDEHIALLERTIYKFPEDPTIISEVEAYLADRIIVYNPK